MIKVLNSDDQNLSCFLKSHFSIDVFWRGLGTMGWKQQRHLGTKEKINKLKVQQNLYFVFKYYNSNLSQESLSLSFIYSLVCQHKSILFAQR